MCMRDILSDTRCDTLSHNVMCAQGQICREKLSCESVSLHTSSRERLLPHCRLPLHHPTRARPGRRKIDSHVTLFMRRAVLQRSSSYKSVLVPASTMDTGCCATADFKAFSLSVDMSLFPVTLPWSISTLHWKPCKHLSWRCNPDLRAQCILFGEIESISHEPTVTSGIDRVTIYELLLRHGLSPSITHCESFLQCACGAEGQTRTALTLVLKFLFRFFVACRQFSKATFRMWA